MMGFRWGSGERWYYQTQGSELQFPDAWGATQNAKNYLRDMVVFKTHPPGQVVLTQNVDTETTEPRREWNGYCYLPVWPVPNLSFLKLPTSFKHTNIEEPTLLLSIERALISSFNPHETPLPNGHVTTSVVSGKETESQRHREWHRLWSEFPAQAANHVTELASFNSQPQGWVFIYIRQSESWGDGSTGNILALQVLGPEDLKSSFKTSVKWPSIVAHMCNPLCWRDRCRRSHGACWTTSLNYSVCSRPVGNPVSKERQISP